MNRGFYSVMAAEFFSSLADNALLIVAIALLALSGVFMKIYRDYESKYISKTTPVSQPLEYVGKD